MRSMLVGLGLAGLTITLGACGSGGSSSTPGHPSRGAGARFGHPVRVYRLVLDGKSVPHRGARTGTGHAVIAVHARSVVCWRFAHLHGFTGATGAEIRSAPKGKAGKVVIALSRGSHLHHQGCVRAHRAAVAAIERRPHNYYVNVRSRQYPNGAVRAQL
jgi:hypothetical protein